MMTIFKVLEACFFFALDPVLGATLDHIYTILSLSDAPKDRCSTLANFSLDNGVEIADPKGKSLAEDWTRTV